MSRTLLDGELQQIQDDVLALASMVEEALLKIDRSNHLLWAAHSLERAADRVTNICERVVFAVAGEMVEMDGGTPVVDGDLGQTSSAASTLVEKIARRLG
jgi:hypothetical protein